MAEAGDRPGLSGPGGVGTGRAARRSIVARAFIASGATLAIGAASPGARQATIDFERFPDGRVPPAPYAASDEWEAEGLRLSFRSWTSDSTLPSVLDAREYLPPGHGRLALGPAFQEERGLEVGVLQMDFPGRPRTVSFSLFGPDLVRYFDVSARGAGGPEGPSIERAPGGTYDASGRGRFRAERITVRAEGGIRQISLDGWGPPGHILLVDDLVISP
jgi:hypothetical protein